MLKNCAKEMSKMYFIKIFDLETKLRFEERYESYYDFRKRVITLDHGMIVKDRQAGTYD